MSDFIQAILQFFIDFFDALNDFLTGIGSRGIGGIIDVGGLIDDITGGEEETEANLPD